MAIFVCYCEDQVRPPAPGAPQCDQCCNFVTDWSCVEQTIPAWA